MKDNLLEEVLHTISPSGYENEMTSLFSKHMEEIGAKKEFADEVGNVGYSIGNGDKVIMISAHCDEIGMQVQYIDDDGFIHFIKDGGIDRKAILASQVAIMHDGAVVPGVIGKKPIHIEWRGEEKDKVTDIKDMKIDIGAESKEEAMALVSVGDPIIVCSYPTDMGKYRFCGRGLDDKVGVFVVMRAMEEISKLEPSSIKGLKVVGVCCTQEETSASGATIAAANLNPAYSIDYDVTFATDDKFVGKEDWGDIRLGGGGCIAHGVDINPSFAKLIKNVCQENNIPFQEFSLGSGGTNTVHIKQSSSNCQTALLSIPNRNMHTAVEVCDYRDIGSLVHMTLETIKKIGY